MSHSIASAWGAYKRPIVTSSTVWKLVVPAGVIAGLAVLAVGLALWFEDRPQPAPNQNREALATSARTRTQRRRGLDPASSVRINPRQQQAIGLKTALVTSERALYVLSAPGQVVPNGSRYAYITPRAAGVVRSVLAHVGQDVKAGDLLATIDSPEVGTARLELYTRLQKLEVAQSQADWQRTIYRNTLDLIDQLHNEKSPEEIHDGFEDRPVGQNRERLLTAYAQSRLATATLERNRELYAQQLITTKQFQKVNADYEVAEATYHSLMDQIGYEVRLAHTRAQQELRQAETAVRAAQEHLRILGVKPDGTEPEVERGKVVGVKPDGTLESEESGIETEARPEKILPPDNESAASVKPVGAETTGEDIELQGAPVSTYSIWAPFDGTILERQQIVPGVPVDTNHRIFTIADLSTVRIEARVHESDFGILAKTRGGKVRLRSPAYPDRVFEGEVLYGGDLVEEKSRAVKLLAQADNPDRLLKPGMFVEVEIVSPGEGMVSMVPESALLTDGTQSHVYVRGGPNLFLRRNIAAEPPRDGMIAVDKGLELGEEVVVEGVFKLRSLALQKAGTAG